MPVNPLSAIAAYNKAVAKIQAPGLESRDRGMGEAFADMVKSALSSTVEASASGEAMAAQAVAGDANISDVVAAVTNAELTLETVVAVRDRVVQAYQEILRMPI